MKRQPAFNCQRYELWQDANGYMLLSEGHSQRNTLVEQPAKLLTIIETETFEQACRERDRYLGWGTDPRDDL